jgi:hypothetical protein
VARGRSITVLLLALPLCVIRGALGCGYAFVGAPAPGVEGGGEPLRVAIRTFENTTTEPGADLVVTDALRRELYDRPRVRVVQEPRAADWVVDGKVGPVRIRTETFSSVVLALEQSLTLSVSLEIRDREGQPLDLSDAALSGTEVYLASADVEVSRKNRSEALQRVAGIIAERIGDALEMEGAP